VARNRGVVRALSAALGRPVAVPDEPDTVGALGAALIARDRAP
jgi:activator of 2-hydroxyglutaryl-CoA dehydratase